MAAIERELQIGYSTLEEVLAEKGVDLEQHLAALKAEIEAFERAGLVHPFGPDATKWQAEADATEDDAKEADSEDDEEDEPPVMPARKPERMRKATQDRRA